MIYKFPLWCLSIIYNTQHVVEIKNSTDPSGLIIAWIEVESDRIAEIRDYAWSAATVTDANNQFTYIVAAGTYKVLIVAQDESGQYTLWNANTNSPGNFDVSDTSFTVLDRKSPIDLAQKHHLRGSLFNTNFPFF